MSVQRPGLSSAVVLAVAAVIGSCGGVPSPAVDVEPVIDSVIAIPLLEIPSPPTEVLLPLGDSSASTDDTLAALREPAARAVRVCAGGDVMLGNNLDTLWAARAAARLGRPVPPRPNPDSLLAPLAPLVEDADVVLLNVEGAIGDGPAPPKCRPGSNSCYAFRQDVAAALALGRFAAPATVVGNVANNHAMDAGLSGFRATLRNLGLAGVYATGADTLPTTVTTSSGDTVAFLGFSTAQAGPDPRDLAAVRRYVSRAAVRFPRLVITAHMGAEGASAQRTHDETETYLGENRGNVVAFAATAVEAGASVVFLHGPHVLRAAERKGDALVFYSLGNLLTYGPFTLAEPLNRGALACVALDGRGHVTEAALRPTWQRPPGLVEADLSARAVALVDSLSRLDFPGTRVPWVSEGVVRSSFFVRDVPHQ